MTITNPTLLPKVRSDMIMAAAAGMPCALRISSLYPGHKCSGSNTTVSCHLPVTGKGTGTKVTDLAVVFGCSHCHDILDGRDGAKLDYIKGKYPSALLDRMLNGLVETQARLLGEAIIFVNDGEII